MSSLLLQFFLTNCLNLQPKAAAKALNLAYNIVPLDGRITEPQVVGEAASMMAGQMNRGFHPLGMFRLLPAQMIPALRNRQFSTSYTPGAHQLPNTGGNTGGNPGGGGGPSNDGILGKEPTFLYQRECTAAWCTGGKDYPGAGGGLSEKKNYHLGGHQLGDNRPCMGCVYEQRRGGRRR